MSHIIGRPEEDLLDVMLGHGNDPEQAFIRGSEQGLEEGDGLEDRAGRGALEPRVAARPGTGQAGQTPQSRSS